jgi:uncharacterized protein (TIGR03435 family)
LAILSILASSLIAYAQIPPQTTVTSDASVKAPSLDVISIRLNNDGGGMMGLKYSPSGIRVTNGSPHMLLMAAYGINEDLLIGEPGWTRTVRFDVEGKATGSDSVAKSESTPDERKLMLQQVLVDRFHLVAHRETREMPVYVLNIAKGGAKLKPSEPAAEPKKPSVMAGESTIDAHDSPLSLLATILSNQLRLKVIDNTGLAGNFEIRMNWTPDQFTSPRGSATLPTADADSGPSIFTALEQQLGLKLNSAKGPVEVVVIDRIEKPSEN